MKGTILIKTFLFFRKRYLIPILLKNISKAQSSNKIAKALQSSLTKLF